MSIAEPELNLSLDQVLEFNELIKSLSNAGVPIALGHVRGSDDLSDQLSAITHQLALSAGKNESLVESLRNNQSIPQAYRTALEAWRRSGGMGRSLDGLHALALTGQEMHTSICQGILRPAVILLLVVAGFGCLGYWFVPHLESITRQLRVQPSSSLSILRVASDWYPVWGTVLALLSLLMIAYGVLSRARDWFGWLPGTAKMERLSELASIAKLMEVVRSQGGAIRPLLDVSLHSNAEEAPGEVSRASKVAPVLAWAVHPISDATPNESSLRMAERFYRDGFRSQAVRWGLWLPAVLGTILAGGIVLVYGLGLFVPLIELLYTLIRPARG